MKKPLKKLYDFSNSWTGTIVLVLIFIFFVAQAFVIPSGSMKNSLLIGDFLFAKKFAYGVPTPHIPWLEIPVWFDSDNDGHIIKGKGPKRGDIVIFRNPKEPKIHFVKRAFAISGDEVIFARNAMYLRPNEGDDFIEQNYPQEDIVELFGKKFVYEPYKFKGINYTINPAVGDPFDKLVQLSLLNLSPMNQAQVPELGSGGELYFNAFYFKVPKDEYFMIGDNRNNSEDSRFWGSVPYKLIEGKPWFVYFSLDKNYKIRWERIGRLVSTLETDERYIYPQD